MRLTEILESLGRDRVADVASKLDLSRSGTKGAMISSITRTAAKRVSPDGRVGWASGLQHVVMNCLTRQDAETILTQWDWPGHHFDFRVTSARLRDIGPDDVRRMLVDVALAEEERSYEELDEFFARGPWANYFKACSDDVDDATDVVMPEDEEDELESEEGAVEGEAAPWHSQVVFAAGKNAPLPLGLESRQHALFEHQLRSVAKLDAWWSGPERAGVLCLPTGAGKTHTTVQFALDAVVRAGGKVLWLAHRRELVNQAIAAFLQSGARLEREFRVGRFEAGLRKHPEPVDVTVASISTLAWGRRAKNLRTLLRVQRSDYSLVIVDECHHSVASSWKRLIGHIRQAMHGEKLLGLSATPTRTSTRERPELWAIWGRIIHEEAPLPLMKAGVLARPRIRIVPTGKTFEVTAEERRLYEKFQELPTGLVSRIGTDAARNELIVRHLDELRQQWGQTLLFAADIKHGRLLVARMKEKGIEARLLHGETPPEERRSVLDEFSNRRFPVLVNVSLFTEGTDVPAVQSVFIARPSQSRILFQQMVGRGLRGPALGGTEVCHVVGFHDNLSQLVDEQLTSSFLDERNALAALGMEEAPPESAPAPVEAEDLEVPPDSGLEARAFEKLVADILAALNAPEAKGPAWRSALGYPLLGWWEVYARERVQFLPVFDGSEGSTRAAVEAAMQSSGPAGPELKKLASRARWVPLEAVLRFIELLTDRVGNPRYVKLESASAEMVRRVMASIVPAPTVAAPAAAATQPSPTSAVTTPWLDLARARLAASDGDVVAELEGKPTSFPKSTWAALEAHWNLSRQFFGDKRDEGSVRFFVSQALGMNVLPGVETDVARRLLEETARAGRLPTLCDAYRSPVPAEVLAELRLLSPAARTAALSEARQAWFQQPEAWAEFLSLMVAAVV